MTQSYVVGREKFFLHIIYPLLFPEFSLLHACMPEELFDVVKGKEAVRYRVKDIS